MDLLRKRNQKLEEWKWKIRIWIVNTWDNLDLEKSEERIKDSPAMMKKELENKWGYYLKVF